MNSEDLDVKIGTPEEALLETVKESMEKQLLNMKLEQELLENNLEFIKKKCT